MLGSCEAANARDFDSRIRGFESLLPSQSGVICPVALESCGRVEARTTDSGVCKATTLNMGLLVMEGKAILDTTKSQRCLYCPLV